MGRRHYFFGRGDSDDTPAPGQSIRCIDGLVVAHSEPQRVQSRYHEQCQRGRNEQTAHDRDCHGTSRTEKTGLENGLADLTLDGMTSAPRRHSSKGTSASGTSAHEHGISAGLGGPAPLATPH